MLRSGNNFICDCSDRTCTHCSHNVPVKIYKKHMIKCCNHFICECFDKTCTHYSHNNQANSCNKNNDYNAQSKL
jgi:hypothetical protein